MADNKDVIQAFINKKECKTRHMYTDGRTIWSYGSHFPMAVHANLPYEHMTTIFYHNHKYSRTTSKQQCQLMNEIRFTNYEKIKLDLSQVQAIVESPKDVSILVTKQVIEPSDFAGLIEIIKNFCKKENIKISTKKLNSLFVAAKI